MSPCFVLAFWVRAWAAAYLVAYTHAHGPWCVRLTMLSLPLGAQVVAVTAAAFEGPAFDGEVHLTLSGTWGTTDEQQLVNNRSVTGCSYYLPTELFWLVLGSRCMA